MPKRSPSRRLLPWVALAAMITPSCDDETTSTSTGGAGSTSASTVASSSDASSSSTGGVVPAGLTAKLDDSHFVTGRGMHAAVELGLAGPALARLLGRDPSRFDGFSATTDTYLDPVAGPTPDPLGFALAVEATEASSAATRALTVELGAGVALEFGGLLNPMGETGDPSATLLRDRIAAFALAAHAIGMSGGSDLVVVPAPADPVNPLGFPGIYPVFAEYRGMSTEVAPAAGAAGNCKIARDPAHAMLAVADHECDATSLHLTSHATQSEEVLAPEAIGYAAWNQALFVARSIGAHDANEVRITDVANADVAQIGVAGNAVVGQYPDPSDPTGATLLPGAPGTYFGVSAIDGFQALLALQALDEKAHFLLTGFTTTDGTALSGGTVQSALDYDFDDPIRWWPASVSVTETATATTPEEEARFFPQPTTLAIGDKTSRLLDLSAIAAAYATVFAMTDAANASFGAAPALRALFDGAPFAADDGVADGEGTLRDRALGVLKIALVDLDRLHFDAAHGAIVDDATITAGVAKKGTVVTTTTLSASIVALRTAYRGLTGTLLPDGNDEPDTTGAASALDTTSLGGAPFQGSLAERLRELVRAQADTIRTRLVGATGVMLSGYDVANNLPDLSPTSLAAQAGGLRGLVEAWLLLGDAKYLDSARIVYGALESTLWNPDTRIYRTQVGENSKMTYDPRTLGILVGALRSYRVAVASAPGEEATAAEIDARLLRVLKVVVNGWNDLDEDAVIDAKECLGAQLLMGERSRTGELGVAGDMGDRDHDCLPDVVKSKRPPVFATELVLTKTLL